jgi:toxin ParE1/3/4
MTPRAHRTPQAKCDLYELAAYIGEHNMGAAMRFLEAAEEAFEQLARMPHMGSAQMFRNPELANLRMWPIPGFEKYLIFYRPTETGIEVIRVLHVARHIKAIFET